MRGSRPATTTARRPRCSAPRTEVQPADHRSGPLPQHHRQRRHRARLRRRGAAAPAGRCSSAPTRSRRPATSCTSCRRYKHFGVYTFQAEDEIAGVGAALGAAFGGAIAHHHHQRSRRRLKAEAIGLAVSVELPLVIVDIQRGGPSTGLPTKTEQADLLLALYGRNGDSPVPDPRARDARPTASHGLRGGAHRGQVHDPGVLALRRLPRQRRRAVADPDGRRPAADRGRSSAPIPRATIPYLRDPRRWRARGRSPARPGLEHRIGGLEKDYLTGNVSYAPTNHEQMVRVRAAQDRRHRARDPADRDRRPRAKATCWWSAGAAPTAPIAGGDQRAARAGHRRSRTCTCATSTRCPPTSATSCARFKQVLVPELNLGQLVKLLRAEYLVDAVGLNKIQGQPFKVERDRRQGAAPAGGMKTA